MIGLGVITYNRLASLKVCLQSIEKFASEPYKLVIVDDGSKDGTERFLREHRYFCVLGHNVGVAGNKNRALSALRDCENIFLIEDDARILRRGWERLFLEASKATAEQHFSFCSEPLKQDIKREVPPYTVVYRTAWRGYFLFLTREVLLRVGGFDLRFGRYGYEHVDFTYRVWKAGLTRGLNPHLLQSDPFVRLDRAVPSTVSPAEFHNWDTRNYPLFIKARQEADLGAIYRPVRIP